MRPYLYSLFIHVLCFQLLFGPSLLDIKSARKPASFSYDLTLEELKERIEEFKVRVKGKEIQPEGCAEDEGSAQSEEELLMMSLFGEDSTIYSREDRAFNKYVDSLQGNACGVVEEPEAAAEEKDCTAEKVEGYIDIKVAEIMESEAEDLETQNDHVEFKLDNPDVRNLHQEATTLMQELRKYLVDDSLSKEDRVDLLVAYLGGVALPMRDLVVVMKAYTSLEYDGVYFYESLLPEFSGSLIEDETTKDLIQSGPNKLVENFYLEVVEKRWGKVELRYNPNDVIARDIVALLQAPTARNYVRASKWMTIQMMLTQVATYDAMMGLDKPIEIPQSCQNSQNGNLPSEIQMQYSSEDGDGLLNRILADHGLIYSEGDTEYSEFYYDLGNKDPMKESYSGLMPFELYKAAMQELYDSEGKERNDVLNASIDDYESFDQVMEIMRPKAINTFYNDHSWVFGLIDFEDEVYQGSTLFDQLLQQPESKEIYEYEIDGSTEEVAHVDQNLSTFLTELMQRHKVSHWENLLEGDLKKQLESQKILIKFPSLYGATAWRMWALTQLDDFANNADLSDIALGAIFNQAYLNVNHQLNNDKSVEGRIKNLKAYLAELKVSDDYIPTRRLNTVEHKKGYMLLGRLWNALYYRDGYLSKAKTNEYEFLKSQMQNGNPWARVRLSYLALLQEIDYIQSSTKPGYSNISQAEYDDISLKACLNKDITSLRKRIVKAGKKMKLNRPLVPGYANEMLDDDERESVFNAVIEKGSPLFKQNNSQGSPYYQDLENVTYQTFLSKEDVEKFVDEKLPEGLQDLAWEGIDDFLATDEADIGRFFTDLYKLKGNPEKQLEYFEEYSQDFGIDNSYDVKRTFLVMDNNIKIHVLKNLLRSSANLRKTKIMDELDKLCQLEPDDHENFKTLFYATSKAQNQLNQLTGAPTIPEEVMSKINEKMTSMSSAEKKDMWLGIGAGVLGVAAMLIGGACTGLSGGICAPLGVAMMAAGASAMTMQVNLMTREYKRKKEADVNEKKILALEELGFANRGSADNVSRSWFWTIFEAVSIIPLVGITARSFKVGTKMTVMFAESTIKQGFRQGFRATAKASGTIYSEADVAFSRLVLGFDSLANQSKGVINSIGKLSGSLKTKIAQMGKGALSRETISKGITRIRNLHKLYAQGKISLTAMTRKIGKIVLGLKGASAQAAKEAAEYTSKVIVKESPEVINKQTAKTVAEYFSENPKGFHYLMKTYAKKVPGAISAMERYEKGTSVFGKVTILPWIRNGIRSLRNSHLNKYAANILRIEKEAAELVAKNGNLEDYILKNIDDLTDIFKDIPVRKREIPYMFFVQGGPHWGKRLSSLGGKTLSKSFIWDSNGLVMKKFFNARSRLIYESMKSEAKTILGLKPFVSSETALESFRAFQESVSNAVTKNGDAGKTELIRMYDAMEEKLAKDIYNVVKGKVADTGALGKLKAKLYRGNNRILAEVSELDEAALRKLIFSPETEQEKAIGSVIWSSLPVEKLFGLDEIGDVAHRVIRDLAQYDNVGEYERLLNAFKVIIIKRDPGVVEIM